MKTKAIVATLLVAAAASADARFAWAYPRKAVSPDEIGHWVVINDNAWPDSTESELTTASPSGWGTGRSKIIANQEGKGRAQEWSVSFCVAGISPLFTGFQRPSSLAKQRSTVRRFQAIRVSKR
jgi:hypothetical protein